ncbi:MAG: hypothetical protein ACKPKO_59280, partial [Candidatus Fonsibacter sp.]
LKDEWGFANPMLSTQHTLLAAFVRVSISSASDFKRCVFAIKKPSRPLTTFTLGPHGNIDMTVRSTFAWATLTPL